VRVLGAEHGAVRPQVARRGQRRERGRGCGVLDVPVQAFRKTEELSHPVDGELLELGRRRRGAPQHRVHVEGGGEELGEDAGLGPRDGEVGEEARVVPVRDPGEEHLVEVAQDGRERLRSVGRGGGEGRTDLARLDLREHGLLANALQ
jgi:hypothetical protein